MQEKKDFYHYILKNKLAIILIISLLTTVETTAQLHRPLQS